MRRFLAHVTAVCVMIVCFFSVTIPVSSQAATLYSSFEDNRTVREELIQQIGIKIPALRTPPIELPRIPRYPVVLVPNTIAAIDQNEYYGRQLLAARENTDLAKAYDYLHEQVTNLEQAVGFGEFRVTAQEVATIYYYYRNDHPEAFWLSSKCEWFTFGYSATTGLPNIVFTYEFTVPKEEIPALQQQLKTRTEEFLEGITGDMSEEQRERLVVERLNAAAVYDHSKQAPHNHDALGVLLNGTGVCESYARAFQYLMYNCGIQCLHVSGDTADGPHAWNMVNIDGEWLMVDPTCCDSGTTDAIISDFYNFTYAEFLEKSWYVNIKVGDPYNYPLPI